MTSGYLEHPQATEELLDTLRYYHRQQPQLAARFSDAATQAIRDITDAPTAWPKLAYWDEEPTIRRRSIRGFPYAVFYMTRGNQVVIVAYAHERRQPGYWAERLDA